jgi:hypothetical protein
MECFAQRAAATGSSEGGRSGADMAMAKDEVSLKQGKVKAVLPSGTCRSILISCGPNGFKG